MAKPNGQVVCSWGWWCGSAAEPCGQKVCSFGIDREKRGCVAQLRSLIVRWLVLGEEPYTYSLCELFS